MTRHIEDIRKEKALTLEKTSELVRQFAIQYQPLFSAVDNILIVGIGRKEGEINNEPNIVAYLQNNKLIGILPSTYHGVQVVVKIIGTIRPA